MSDIRVDMDISSVVDNTAKLLRLNKQQQESLKELVATTINLGEKNKAVNVYTEAQISANQKLLLTVRNLGTENERVERNIKSTTDALRRQREEIQRTLSVDVRGRLDKIISKTGVNFSPDELAKIEKIKSSISKLDTEVVTPKAITEFFNAIKKGNIPETTGQLAKLRDELVKLNNITVKGKERIADSVTNATAENRSRLTARDNARRSAEFRSNFENDFVNQLEQQFKIKRSDLTTRQEGVLRNTASALAKQIQTSQSGLNLNEVRGLFDQVRNGGVIQAPATPELAKTAAELTKIIGLFERLRQERDRQARVNQNALDQRLISDQEANRAEKKIQIIQERMRRLLDPVRSNINNVDPSLDPDKNGRLTSLLRKIGEFGTKSGLSSRQVSELYQRLNGNQLTPTDAKYSRLIELLNKINRELDRAKQNANAFSGRTLFPDVPPGGGSRLPPGLGGSGANLPPNRDDVDRAQKFTTLYEKIRNSLDYFLLYKGFNVFTSSLGTAYENAKRFQIQISLIRTISQDAQLSSREWERGLIAVSNKTGIDFLDVSNAAYDAISNQITRGRQTFEFVRQAGDLARTTNSTLQDSVNLLSSAINSYSFDIGDADAISAKFFKTIDLGRIKAGDLSNTFGRVAFVGRDLGVEFEELLAILSTLTRKGITTDDAITLLTNGMNKLTNPTEKMRALLNEWGYSSGRAAVANMGFVETMARLVEATESGRLEISDLFNEIRGEKYASAFKTFKGEIFRDLDEIKNKSLDTYRAAVDIRGESNADVINRQINELKNALATNFGNKLTDLAKRFIEMSGGVETLVKNLNRLSDVVIIGGSAFLTYKTAILGAQIVGAVYDAALAVGTVGKLAYARATGVAAASEALFARGVASSTGQVGANTTALAANRAALIAHPIGLLLAAGAAIYAYWKTSNFEIGVHNEKMQAVNEEYDRLLKKQQQVKREDVFKDYKADLEKATEGLKGLGKEIATDLSKANKELDGAKERSTKTADSLKEGFEKYTNFMKDRISEISKEYNKLDDRIKNSNKSILDLREIARRQSYETQIKYSGGFEFDQFGQRERLMVQEQSRLKEEIKRLFSSGVDEDVQKARQLAAEYLRMEKEIFDLRQEREGLNFNEAVKSNPSSFAPDRYGKVYRGVDTRPFEARQQGFLKFVDGLETDYQARQKANNVIDEKRLLAAKDRLNKAENAIKDLDNIKIFDAGGNVTPEFKDQTTGRVDLNKVRVKFNQARERLNKTLDPEVLKKLGPEIDKLLDERLEALQAEITATERVDILRKKQNEVIESSKKLQQSFQEGRADVQKYAQEVQTLTEKLDNLGESLKSVYSDDFAGNLAEQTVQRKGSSAVDRGAKRFQERVLKAGNFIVPDEYTAPTLTDDAKKKLTEYRAEVERARGLANELPKKLITKDGIQRLDPEEVEKVIAAYERQIAKAKEFAKVLAGGDVEKQRGIETNLGIAKYEALLEDLKGDLRRAGENYNKSSQSLAVLRQDTQLITGDIDRAVLGIKEFGPAANESVGGAAKQFQSFNAELAETNRQVDGILGKLSALRYINPEAKLPETKIEPPKIQSVPKDIVSPKALGGLMPYYASGGPVGSDMQQVYAQAGEYIWNRVATRRFYAQISSMNHQGRTPVEFYTNEGNTVNVGGITINESKNPQLTGAEIDRTLRRHQRRG
jgi:TP901 family phage tail tape measure protein